ncbi:MAG: hypothetical protein WBW61_11120 [Rhodanobacteraceae bacterium]
MRYLACLIFGVCVGALAATTLANALRARDVWPRSIMRVMQHELAEAHRAVRARRCTDDDLESALAHLGLLSGDIQPAVQPQPPPDRAFARYATHLRSAIATARLAGPDCARRLRTLDAIGRACDACHRDYR